MEPSACLPVSVHGGERATFLFHYLWWTFLLVQKNITYLMSFTGLKPPSRNMPLIKYKRTIAQIKRLTGKYLHPPVVFCYVCWISTRLCVLSRSAELSLSIQLFYIDIANQRNHLLLWRSSQLRCRSPNLPYLIQTILHWLERCPMKLPSTSYPPMNFGGSEEN